MAERVPPCEAPVVKRRVGTVALLVVVLAWVASPATAATCEAFGGVREANPAPVEVAEEVRRVAEARAVPAVVLAAVAFVEGYDPAVAKNWVQFTADGSPLVSADCGIGLMQLTGAAGFDQQRLASDWRYNLDAGAAVLRDKWEESQAANPASIGRDDQGLLENWWAAVYRYNGSGAAATAYADRVFAQIVDPQAEPAAFVPPAPALRTPTQVFPDYTASRQFQARATEAVLAEADGTIVRRDGTFRGTPVPAQDRPPAPRVAADAPAAVEAGVQLSRTVFADDGARHVLLARNDDWADALAGAALSGTWGPILYVSGGPAGTLPAATRAELARVAAAGGTVYLLGGTAAISPAVEAAVAGDGFQPRRLAGTDRLGTAVEVAREVRRLDQSATEIVIARAFTSPADALTAGAAAGHRHRPLVLTPTESMPQAVRDAVASLGPRTAVVVGGTAAVSDAVVEELRASGLTVDRAAGVDRYGTAVAVATRLWGGVGKNVTAVDVATDGGWPWALAAGSLSALLEAPQLGVAPTNAPAVTLDAVRSAGGTAAAPARVVVVGDANRAATAVRQALRQAAEGT